MVLQRVLLTVWLLMTTEQKCIMLVLLEKYTSSHYQLHLALSSATYSSGEDCNFTTAVQVKPQDITFNSDGTAMFVTGSNPDDINKFSLSVPYDVSTCDIDGRSTHVVGGDPRGISFNNDGTKLFIYNGNGNDGNDSVKINTHYKVHLTYLIWYCRNHTLVQMAQH